MTSVETIVEIANGKTARVGVPLSRSLNFLKIRDVNDLSFPVKGRFSKAAVSGQNYTTVYEGMTFDTGKHGDFDCVELLNESGVDLTITILCSDGVILDFVGQKQRDAESADMYFRNVAAGTPILLLPGRTLMLTSSDDLTNSDVFYCDDSARLFLRSIQISVAPRNSLAVGSFGFRFNHSAYADSVYFFRGNRASASSSYTPNFVTLNFDAVVNETYPFILNCTTVNTDFVLIVKT